MTTATITPLRDGAVLEVGGRPERYGSFAAAMAEAYARQLWVHVDPFPHPPIVLATRPTGP